MRATSPIFVALVLGVWCLSVCSTSAQDPVNPQSCIKCHLKPAGAVTDQRIFDEDLWKAGVHADVECTECHRAADAGAFDTIPHGLIDPAPVCAECHTSRFKKTAEELARSVHAEQIEHFGCVRCHDPHIMPIGQSALPREERVGEANRACIQCHRNAAAGTSGREPTKGLQEAHAWDPAIEAHARMRCIVCHTPIDNSNAHEVLPSDRAIRSCDACHDVNAPLIAEYVDQADPSFWVTNPLLFENAYLPGATRNRVVDGLLVALFWLTVCGVVGHGLLRVLTRQNRSRMSAVAEKVKMYPVWLRFWHWSNAILFVVLAYTGVRLHFGHRRGPIMSFETAFDLHNLAGSLLVVVGLLFFVGNVLGQNQQQYLSRPRDGFGGILRQLRWYLIGIFKGESHPYHTAPEHKFNPLQHITYVGIMYVVYPLLLLSGVALLFPGFLPGKVLGYPGTFWIAAIHWTVSAAGILFLVGHLYLGSMGDKVRDLYAAMLDGYHRHRRREP